MFGVVTLLTLLPLMFVVSGTEVRIISSRKNAMPLLSQYGAYQSGNAFITFKIKASYDGVLTLMSQANVITSHNYVIIISGDNNLTSEIQYLRTTNVIQKPVDFSFPVGPTLASHTESLLDPTQYIQFWVSWYGGVVRVGKGQTFNNNEIMSISMDCPFEVQEIALGGINSTHVDWLITTTPNNDATTTTTTVPSMTSAASPTISCSSLNKLLTKFTRPDSCPEFEQLSASVVDSTVVCVTMCGEQSQCKHAKFSRDSNICSLCSNYATGIEFSNNTYKKVDNV